MNPETAAVRLRIAIVLKTATGGAWVVPHIREMTRRGHTVVLIIPAGPGRLREALSDEGIEIVDSPFDFSFRPSIRLIRGLWALRKLLRTWTPDVLHYHLYASALAGRFATVGWNLPRIHMVAGPLYLESATIRFFERHLARLDTVIVGGSDFTVDRYRELRDEPPRVVAIPYGVSTADFVPPTEEEREEARATLGLPDSAFTFVMVAFTYAPKKMVHSGYGIKGHDVLLEAWQKVSKAAPQARLIIVGGGFDSSGEMHRQQLMDRFDVSNPASKIQWLESVADVRPYYFAADVSVCPSLSENHGAALEATSSGVPCIVSDAGALPETVTAETGWVVPRGDSDALAGQMIAVSLGGRHESATHGRLARQRTVAEFDSSVLAKKLVLLIESTVSTSR